MNGTSNLPDCCVDTILARVREAKVNLMSDERFDKLLKVLVQIQLSIRDTRPEVLPPSPDVQLLVG